MSENLHFANCFSFKGLGNCNVMQFKMRGAGFGGGDRGKESASQSNRQSWNYFRDGKEKERWNFQI